MLIDFCDGQLDPAISCDKVCADGFEVDNLISTDIRTRNKGFISESFINPPVNIRVVFPCNIQIYRIVINPVVGRQKSTGFEIFTCCHSHTPGSKERDQRGYHKRESATSSNELFLPVGKVLLQEPSVVCFQSVHFRITDQWRPDNVPDVGQYQVVRDLRHAKVGYLNHVQQVTIRINRTVGGSAPCIRRLEIWGKPPTSCPQYLNDKIRQILFPSFFSFQKQSGSSGLDEDRSCTDKQSGSHGNHLTEVHEENHTNIFENGVEIPDEFIDSITCDMMTNPLLLPCGKNIDISTLEKHISAEASWGRPACDPFTGILLDDKNQAIPNSHLKSRIDQFILKHSELLKNLPRTLGESKGQGPLSSRLVQPKCGSKVENKEPSLKNEILKVQCQYNSFNSKQSVNLENDPLQKELKRKHFLCSDFDDNMPSCSSERTTVQLTESPNKKIYHEDKLQQSLDSALDNMLGHLPTFRKSSLTSKADQENGLEENSVPQGFNTSKGTIDNFQVENSYSAISNDTQSTSGKLSNISYSLSRTGDMNCVHCGKNETVAWYKVTCGHLYCRNCVKSCVTQSESMECHQCHNICSKSDIMRVFQS